MTKDNQLTKDYRRPGYSAVTPGLSVNGSAALLDFLKRASTHATATSTGTPIAPSDMARS